MRRLPLPLLVAALLGATAAPAMAQGGASAPAPGADSSPSGGQAYERYPAQRLAEKPARKRKAGKQVARGQRKSGGRPIRIPPRPADKGHRFPIMGAYTFGGKDSRFGSGRKGHTHQGQDLAAAEGTPVVAPRTGTVEAVRYQAAGAGHYVVLDGDGEDRDYVFMHLRAGSIVVDEGDKVRIGELLGQVGNTGVSSGPHLHFEIWVRGGWYTGGEPIDPLRILRAWARV